MFKMAPPLPDLDWVARGPQALSWDDACLEISSTFGVELKVLKVNDLLTSLSIRDEKPHLLGKEAGLACGTALEKLTILMGEWSDRGRLIVCCQASREVGHVWEMAGMHLVPFVENSRFLHGLPFFESDVLIFDISHHRIWMRRDDHIYRRGRKT